MDTTDSRIGTNIHITNELARIVGLVANEHPGHSIEIRWIEDSDLTYWAILTSNGEDDRVYVADDEQGTWAPATADERRAIENNEPLVYPNSDPDVF